MITRPPATIAKSVQSAWSLLKQQIGNIHGEPRIKYGPTWRPEEGGGFGRRTGAVWFVDIAGTPKNHNLSITEYGHLDRPSHWIIEGGRHGGIITHVAYDVRGVFPVELLHLAARSVGLLPPAHTDADDLDTVREIAARANGNAEQLDPGVILDIVGWPSTAGDRIPT
jgi:hypothetical protein